MARIHLVEEMRAHAWTLRYSKCELRTRRSKVPGERKPGRNAALKCLRRPQGQASLRACPWVYPHRLFLPAPHCLLSLREFISSKPVHQGPATGHWSFRLWWLGCSTSSPQPDSHLWPGTETLLQGAAGGGLEISTRWHLPRSWPGATSTASQAPRSVLSSVSRGGRIVPLSGLLRLVTFGS